MPDINNVILGIHAIAGVLWIVLEIILAILLYTGRKSQSSEFRKTEIRNMVMRIRATGGITIILGIVLLAILSSQSKLPSFSSLHGILLLIGIALALIVYVVINEGFLFRMISGGKARSGDLFKASFASSILAVIVLILMVAGAS